MTRFTIDLDPSDARWFTIAFSDGSTAADRNRADRIACDIGTQIREQLPPERMAEPGWGEKVVATWVDPRNQPGPWLHFSHGQIRPWINDLGVRANWSDLIDPEPVDRG